MISLMRVLRRLAAWLFWPGLALIVWGELTPDPPAISQHIWDKAEHFTAYFGLAAMATLVIGLRRSLAWAILGVIALGGLLEILQALLGRDAEFGDFIANTIGALTGLAVAGLFIKCTGRRPLVGRDRRN